MWPNKRYDFTELLFPADILKRKDGRRSLLPDYQTVIIDEAQVDDAANQMYGTTIMNMKLIT